MSALAALVRAHERLPDAPPFGYSVEKIGYLVSLNDDGSPAGLPIDLRQDEGRKKLPRPLLVPRPARRTSGIAPNFLWDKTCYALGVTAGAGRRVAEEHAAFVEAHRRSLADSRDDGLLALRRFLERWSPGEFVRLGWPIDMMDQNVVFRLATERRDDVHIHDRPAARALWGRLCAQDHTSPAVCLVTGERAPIARLHPAIKGVWGAQTSGASIVSFNLDAFASYGHEQGYNAPVSEAAAFAYTSVLNRFLATRSGHRARIGDMSIVFWAEAADTESAGAAERLFSALIGADDVDERRETETFGALLDAVRSGRPIAELQRDLPQGVRFIVLGLAPNAARLSVRFYVEDHFIAISVRCLEHMQRMSLEPPPHEEQPSLWRQLVETAAQRKSENILSALAGAWARSILTGAPYPLTVLATLLMRMRADRDINALRVAMLRAVLVRNFSMEVPVALDLWHRDCGYLLGRLFAAYECAQMLAVGGKARATVRDQYYGAASAAPRAMFPIMRRKAAHHLAQLRTDNPALAMSLERCIREIYDLADAQSLFPLTLGIQRQAQFAIGYHHQRSEFIRRKDERRSKANAVSQGSSA